MGEFNLGKVVGDKGNTGSNGASAWIKYNTLPQDDGASDVWTDGMDYVGFQTLASDTKPMTGYMWAVFVKGGTPYDALDSTSPSVPLSANQGRVLQSNIASVDLDVNSKIARIFDNSIYVSLSGSGLSLSVGGGWSGITLSHAGTTMRIDNFRYNRELAENAMEELGYDKRYIGFAIYFSFGLTSKSGRESTVAAYSMSYPRGTTKNHEVSCGWSIFAYEDDLYYNRDNTRDAVVFCVDKLPTTKVLSGKLSNGVEYKFLEEEERKQEEDTDKIFI